MKDLLRKAKREKAKVVRKPSAEYAQVIRMLRKKGFEWQEVQTWLAANGVHFSLRAIQYAGRNT